MEDYGFLRVAAASPRVKVADVEYNADAICRQIEEAESRQVSLLAFPELSLTGYTCADLFGQNLLLARAETAVGRIARCTRGKGLTLMVGAPVRFRNRLYNCAIVIRNGSIKGIVPKIYLPNHNEFYEERWFASGADFLSSSCPSAGRFVDDGKNLYREGSGGSVRYAGGQCNLSPNLLFEIGRATVGIEVGEDLRTPVPPSSYLALAGAEVIVNISASNEVLMRHLYRKEMVLNQSARTRSGYIYCSCGSGESTQDLVFAGSSLICENGSLLAENERFRAEDTLIVADLTSKSSRRFAGKTIPSKRFLRTEPLRQPIPGFIPGSTWDRRPRRIMPSGFSGMWSPIPSSR